MRSFDPPFAPLEATFRGQSQSDPASRIPIAFHNNLIYLRPVSGASLLVRIAKMEHGQDALNTVQFSLSTGGAARGNASVSFVQTRSIQEASS
jgi:hypothetical protein